MSALPRGNHGRLRGSTRRRGPARLQEYVLHGVVFVTLRLLAPDPPAGLQVGSPGLLKRVPFNEISKKHEHKWHGVNYGNRFIPEDWMVHPYNFYKGVRRKRPVERVSLWDLDASQVPCPKKRMLDWLNATILESHFKQMKQLGVEVVRVPCGYWNWVTYPDECGPEAPKDVNGVSVAQRLKNLHRIAKPEEYRMYFDRIFDFAEKNEIRVLLDLHGLPGSQNGEIHSGVCLEMGQEARLTYFEAESNKNMAVHAVRSMAMYAKDIGPTLFGIQVINEPHLNSTDDGKHTTTFLHDYYEQSILAAREFLAMSVPVVLFEWSYGMEKNWIDDPFPEAQFGTVLWDTHLYHYPEDDDNPWKSNANGLARAKKAYKWDLGELRSFSRRQRGRVIVGEFALSGPSLNLAETREFARWLVEQFDFAAAGCMLWSFDGKSTKWSMQRQEAHWGIDWKHLFNGVDGERMLEGAPLFLEAASQAGFWLSARQDGTVRVMQGEPSYWEEWIPYYSGSRQKSSASKLSLRSSAHGTWLSVNEGGQVSQSTIKSYWEEFTTVVYDVDGQHLLALRSFHGSWLSTYVELEGVAMAAHGPEAHPQNLDGFWRTSP